MHSDAGRRTALLGRDKMNKSAYLVAAGLRSSLRIPAERGYELIHNRYGNLIHSGNHWNCSHP
jgi:hypothetical protein